MGNHHTRIRPVKLHLKPLISIGGNCSIPSFVKVNPTPQRMGTDIASIRSRKGIENELVFKIYF